jgi:hypothetical protein
MRFVEWLQYAAWLILFFPFWLFGRLLRRRQKERRGYGDYNETWQKGYHL